VADHSVAEVYRSDQAVMSIVEQPLRFEPAAVRQNMLAEFPESTQVLPIGAERSIRGIEAWRLRPPQDRVSGRGAIRIWGKRADCARERDDLG
jgi:hypothetical protein